ncbi:MAG: hypothetical protein P8Z68_05780 [Kineosporiaceae bacterium]
MGTGVWQGFARAQVLPRLPGMALSGAVLHLPDTTWMLRGVAMVPARSQDSFWLWAFIQPLYVPADRLNFRYGQRLGRMSDRRLTGWPARFDRALGTEIARSVRTQGLPGLAAVRDPGDLLSLVRAQDGAATDLDHWEAAVYSAILAGDRATVRLIGQQVRELPENGAVGAVGAAEHRMRRVIAGYERDVGGTEIMLRRWRNATARALRLPRTTGTGPPG